MYLLISLALAEDEQCSEFSPFEEEELAVEFGETASGEADGTLGFYVPEASRDVEFQIVLTARYGVYR